MFYALYDFTTEWDDTVNINNEVKRRARKSNDIFLSTLRKAMKTLSGYLLTTSLMIYGFSYLSV
jgi:hypothetical protein